MKHKQSSVVPWRGTFISLIVVCGLMTALFVMNASGR